MKKMLFGAVGLIMGLTSTGLSAQNQQQMQLPPAESMQLPADTTVRHGILPNGLTYYIRHNET
ncbi:MAG: hypothetical protein K2O10_03955, partial [Muribaculaceae bacterium]|nr:hypothetical protein [Muribaculaceae bacterium]